MCLLTAVVEGFDQQILAVAEPSLLRSLGEDIANIGPLYSIGLFAFVLGGLVLGPLGDRIGRKWLLIVSLITFGAATLVIPQLSSLTEVMIARVVSGFAFGGAAVSFIALPVEYSPGHLRSRVVAIIWAGLPIGGVISSLTGNALIETQGWQTLFLIGGVFPLLLAAILVTWLPESIGFLIVRGQNPAKVAALLRKIAPQASFNFDKMVLPTQPAEAAAPVRRLFDEGRAFGSCMIWLALLLSYMIINLVVAWTPTLLAEAGAPIGMASLSLALFNGVSLLAIFSLSYLLDRGHARAIIVGSFCSTAVGVLIFAALPMSTASIFAAVAMIGFLIGGGATALVAVAAIHYPTELRATGVGWSLAFARIGSICGPLVGSVFFAYGLTIDMFFAAIALPAAMTAVTFLFFGRDQRGRHSGWKSAHVENPGSDASVHSSGRRAPERHD